MASEGATPRLVERELTDQLARSFASDDPRVLVGIGDDGAVVRTTRSTVVACDPVVETVHFTRGESLEQVGCKAVNRNLSDLAAMGARPGFLLVSLLLSDWLTKAGRDQLIRGIQKAARAGGCTVVGGDVARTPGPLVVTVTVLGEAPERPLRRSGLRVGDALHVTGPLGGSRLGRHLSFRPRLAEGDWLARQSVVTAAIDISDGLLVDLATMLLASGGQSGELGAVLDVEAIPQTTAARRAAVASGHDSLSHALHDGEDHELLFGLAGDLPVGSPLTTRARRSIGVVTATPGIFLRDRQGITRQCRVAGYQHDV